MQMQKKSHVKLTFQSINYHFNICSIIIMYIRISVFIYCVSVRSTVQRKFSSKSIRSLICNRNQMQDITYSFYLKTLLPCIAYNI